MTFVAITKRVGDLDPKEKKAFKHLPDGYPLECKELKSEAEVDAHLSLHPGDQVVTHEQYKGMEMAHALIYEDAVAKQKRSWKFWR